MAAFDCGSMLGLPNIYIRTEEIGGAIVYRHCCDPPGTERTAPAGTPLFMTMPMTAPAETEQDPPAGQ